MMHTKDEGYHEEDENALQVDGRDGGRRMECTKAT
jgi:hypothetical protein